jgi:hypothetical protein
MNRDIRLAAIGFLVVAAGLAAFFFLREADEPSSRLEENSAAAAPEKPKTPDVRRDLGSEKKTESAPAPKSVSSSLADALPQPAAAVDAFGTPFGAIYGVVRDPAGKPVRDASVKLAIETVPNPAISLPIVGKSVAEAKTKDDGVYFFDGIPTYDNYVLVGAHADFATAKIHPVKLVPTRTTEIDVSFSEGVAVTGLVVDESGRPISGARVVCRWGREAAIDPIRSVERETTAGPDGRYMIERVVSASPHPRKATRSPSAATSACSLAARTKRSISR